MTTIKAMRKKNATLLVGNLLVTATMAATPVTPRFEVFEVELTGAKSYANPFLDVAVTAMFTAPCGRKVTAHGFHDGSNIWRVRFAPDASGAWSYVTSASDTNNAGLHHRTGSLTCAPSAHHGFIRIHPDNPYAFAYTDGTAFFPMGDTCYGLFDDSHITPALRREYLETRRRQRFNFVRMTLGHSEARAAQDPAFWAWGGTPAKPDLDRFNPEFFRGLDEMFRDLQARRMNVELILFNFYRRPFTDTKLWTPVRERSWLRYVLARYAAFRNVFLWTLANEYETHPDGVYRLDRPGDVEWAQATARLVKQFDPYRHPVTVHPVISASALGSWPGDPFEPPWRIGPFFGQGEALDVLSQQTGQSGKDVHWDEQRACWTGDDPLLVASLRADRRFQKPVLNTENGYEYFAGQHTYRKQVHHTDKVRRSSWRIVCAGGYFAAGFQGTVGQSDIWNRIDAPRHYTFAVQDAGAAPQLGVLYDFFAALPFWRMQPFEGVDGREAVALAEPGMVYVVYLPHGGKVTVDLTAAKGTLSGHWFNPRDRTAGEPFEVAGDRSGEFKSPTTDDWVLLLRSGLRRGTAQSTSDPSAAAGLVLGIDGTAFTLNGKTTFLLGASYYGALGAPDDFMARDLDDLRALGFNWVRVFAVWDAFDHNVSAVDLTGQAREPYLAKLKAVVNAAEKRGMVVDVTLSRMPCLLNQAAHLGAVETLAKALKGCRNVYFDLANERDQNYAGGTFVSFSELKALRDRVKAADPDRLVTASGQPTDQADLARYLVEAGLDFIAPHLARDAGTEQRTAEATRRYFGWMKELGRVVPIHYQEPFRRDYLDYRGFWQPEVETFCVDLRNAKLGGAAGWCFHNGSPSPPERFPASKRRSFDLRHSQGRLIDQLDAVERQFLKRAASCAQ
ncbi:MAG TPA: DUF4038 domain-containing protein [Verrucomicrobiota bacterium]|nr:DUF4038 domain-containing protein [Verrucomicrobiota bacterium]